MIVPRLVSIAIVIGLFANVTWAAPFSFTFDWSNLKKCTSGDPNTVKNPTFVVSGLPDGTKGIYFRLTDKNVPTYNHGGGWVAIDKDGTIRPGAFTYLSPCPPDGSHTYEWSADARASRTGKLIKRAKASRRYP